MDASLGEKGLRWWWRWWVVAVVVAAEREGGRAHVRVDWMLPGVQALIQSGLVGGDESRTMRGVYLGEGGDWIYTWG